MKELKVSWKQIYIACIFAWSFMYTIVNESYIALPGKIYTYVWLAVRLLLIAKIIFYDARVARKAILSFAIIIFGIISFYYSKSAFLEPFFWFLAAANYVDVQKIIKSVFIAQITAFILIVGLSSIGVITNYQIVRETSNQLRYSLGFTHPNTAALKAFQICLMYVYLVRNKLGIRHCVGILVFESVIYGYTNSNTSFYLIFMLIALVMLYLISKGKVRLLARFSRRIIRLLKYLCIFSVGFSIYMTLNYSSSNSLLNLLGTNNTMLSRFSQMYLYFNTYNITLFGQALYYHGSGNILSDKVTGLYTLDNAYIYLLLGLGIVVFILFLLLYICTMYKSVKERNFIVLILMAVYLILGFSETGLIRFTYNFTLIFIFSFVWKQSLGDEGFYEKLVQNSD